MANSNLKNRTPKGVETVLPFINAKYRAHIRVVDFMPKHLVDFCRHLDDPDYNNSATGLDFDDAGDEDDKPRRWQWSFCLLVEDATCTPGSKETPRRMPLIVAQDGAECLLKMDAGE